MVLYQSWPTGKYPWLGIHFLSESIWPVGVRRLAVQKEFNSSSALIKRLEKGCLANKQPVYSFCLPKIIPRKTATKWHSKMVEILGSGVTQTLVQIPAPPLVRCLALGKSFASLCLCFLSFHIGLILLELQRIRGKYTWMAWNPVVLQIAIDAVPVIIPPSTHSHLMWDLPFFVKSSPLSFTRCVGWLNILGTVSKSLFSQVKLFAGAIPTFPFDWLLCGSLTSKDTTDSNAKYKWGQGKPSQNASGQGQTLQQSSR